MYHIHTLLLHALLITILATPTTSATAKQLDQALTTITDAFSTSTYVYSKRSGEDFTLNCPPGQSIIWGFSYFIGQYAPSKACALENNKPCTVGATSCSVSGAACDTNGYNENAILMLCGDTVIPGSEAVHHALDGSLSAATLRCPTGKSTVFGFSFQYLETFSSCMKDNLAGCPIGPGVDACQGSACNPSGSMVFRYMLCADGVYGEVLGETAVMKSANANEGEQVTLSCDANAPVLLTGLSMAFSGYVSESVAKNDLRPATNICPFGGSSCTLPKASTSANDEGFLFIVCVPVSTPFPTARPTFSPTTSEPTVSPTKFPTHSPTPYPTTAEPTQRPTTPIPTASPTTPQPTSSPSASPTFAPTKSPVPTAEPTASPTRPPTFTPTQSPTTEAQRQQSLVISGDSMTVIGVGVGVGLALLVLGGAGGYMAKKGSRRGAGDDDKGTKELLKTSSSMELPVYSRPISPNGLPMSHSRVQMRPPSNPSTMHQILHGAPKLQARNPLYMRDSNSVYSLDSAGALHRNETAYSHNGTVQPVTSFASNHDVSPIDPSLYLSFNSKGSVMSDSTPPPVPPRNSGGRWAIPSILPEDV